MAQSDLLVCYDAALQEQLLLGGEGLVEAAVDAPSNCSANGSLANQGSAGNDDGRDFGGRSRVTERNSFHCFECQNQIILDTKHLVLGKVFQVIDKLEYPINLKKMIY